MMNTNLFHEGITKLYTFIASIISYTHNPLAHYRLHPPPTLTPRPRLHRNIEEMQMQNTRLLHVVREQNHRLTKFEHQQNTADNTRMRLKDAEKRVADIYESRERQQQMVRHPLYYSIVINYLLIILQYIYNTIYFYILCIINT